MRLDSVTTTPPARAGPAATIATLPMPRLQSALLACTRPLLRLHLALYRRELANTAFPLDEPRFEIPPMNPSRTNQGRDTDEILFVGSIAVAGYGVLRHGMKTSDRTATLLATTRRRGVRWREVSSPTLTVAEAARRESFGAHGSDAAVVILGITDVLLGTDPAAWALDIAVLAARLRAEAGPQCRIVIAGIPPLTDFRPVSAFVDRLMRRQIARLNAVTERVARDLPGTDFVPFPTRKIATMFVHGIFSWATMHSLWARALAPVIAAALDERALSREVDSLAVHA